MLYVKKIENGFLVEAETGRHTTYAKNKDDLIKLIKDKIENEKAE